MWGYACVSRFLVIDLKVIIFSSVESSCTRLPTGMSKTTRHFWSSWFCSSDIRRGQKLPHCNYLILTWITAAERCKEKVNVAWRRSGVASLWRAYMVSNTLTSNSFQAPSGAYWRAHLHNELETNFMSHWGYTIAVSQNMLVSPESGCSVLQESTLKYGRETEFHIFCRDNDHTIKQSLTFVQ